MRVISVSLYGIITNFHLLICTLYLLITNLYSILRTFYFLLSYINKIQPAEIILADHSMSFDILVQYLEAGLQVPADQAREKLRIAFELLPISKVLIGWNLAGELENACSDLCSKQGKELYRWQPLLCSDGKIFPKKEWQTVGLSGKPVQGFMALPEFTFMCPNNPQVCEAVTSNLLSILKKDIFQGVFLDRIRFPSPMTNPREQLACFCPYCRKKASEQGIDLQEIRNILKSFLNDKKLIGALIPLLFPETALETHDSDTRKIQRFFQFRLDSVSEFAGEIAHTIKGHYPVSIGLDCFSFTLTRSIGQDLGRLFLCSDWIKVMTYAHTMGVAGLPFELSAIVNWLKATRLFDEKEALDLVSRSSNIPLGDSINALVNKGLGPFSLRHEIQQALPQCRNRLYAGIELVDEADITNLTDSQIAGDFREFLGSGAHGAVLSWDLWHIPLRRLELIASILNG